MIDKGAKGTRLHSSLVVVAGLVVPAHFLNNIATVGIHFAHIRHVAICHRYRTFLWRSARCFPVGLGRSYPVVSCVTINGHVWTLGMNIVGTPHPITNIVAA